VRHSNDSADFCARVLDATGVGTTPGLDFDRRRGHSAIRLSFAGPESDIIEAMRRLKAWLTACIFNEVTAAFTVMGSQLPR